jgi:hypothetical protein
LGEAADPERSGRLEKIGKSSTLLCSHREGQTEEDVQMDIFELISATATLRK